MYIHNIHPEAPSHNNCCNGKAVSSTCSRCVSVALIIQHAKRMRRFILSYVACLAVLHLSPPLSHKRRHFRKEKL